ncbi:SRPBCC family protein [Streptomyces sp. NPDC002324]
MEHEVFVPVPVGRLREALSDPERVARAVPGLQQEAGAPPVAGRMKVRVAGHTITYRGTLRVTARDDGSYAVEGDATEARGSGTVKLTLTLRLSPATEGTTLVCAGTATADGRITELPADSVSSAMTRLLGRFAENLATTAGPDTGTGTGTDTDTGTKAEVETDVEAEPGPTADAAAETGPPPPVEPEPPASVFETEVPPSPLEPFDEGDFVAGGEPPAEAAHARRTMIGRSAEEVDHAPPRGRYAPVPAPEPASASATLRWAAPAAAFAVASAIIVSRALRKRR